MPEITNTHDVIDSRDLMVAISDLEMLRDDWTDYQNEPDKEGLVAPVEFTSDDQETLDSLQEFADEFEAYAPDYQYGEIAIHDAYFQRYAEELAEDIGAVDQTASWPMTCIDWEQAAHDLQQDYTAISFDGERYWVR